MTTPTPPPAVAGEIVTTGWISDDTPSGRPEAFYLLAASSDDPAAGAAMTDFVRSVGLTTGRMTQTPLPALHFQINPDGTGGLHVHGQPVGARLLDPEYIDLAVANETIVLTVVTTPAASWETVTPSWAEQITRTRPETIALGMVVVSTNGDPMGDLRGLLTVALTDIPTDE